ncbi:hypothetical protein Cni_G26514 [Canna indica]|uniref:Late embryogenesis abundant protein LEA-2 subgroup domain-containing protein n=1 Tax=Canna indica TaxID=4628 RepID=A0AAQ3QM55_9LILI|nr:hypothetical protein Cni_G26514 [Canna indica]
MADSKQAHLNGAYYGPPIPPQQNYRSIGGRSSCCCGPFCLLCSLFKFLVSIVIILGIIVLVLWLVFRPNELNAHVDSASLTQFNFSTANNNLEYDLSLDLSIRNPNKRISIYYDYLEAQPFYNGDRFGFTNDLPTFYQGHKNTTVLRPVFRGSQILFGDSVATTYAREKGEGYYYVDVKLYAKLRVKVWIFKIHYKRPHIDCTLKLPVPGTNGSFERTKCDVHVF